MSDFSSFGSVGSVSVTVRADTSQFQQEVEEGVGQSVERAQGKANLKVTADTTGATGAIDRLTERMTKLIEYSALYKIGSGLEHSISSAFSDAQNEQLLESRAQSIFGANNKNVQKFVDETSKSLLVTKTEAESTAISFGNAFNNLNLDPGTVTKYTEELTTLTAGIHALHPEMGDVQTLIDRITQSIETGQTKGLSKLGIHFSEADITAKAASLGFLHIKGNAKDVEEAQNKVAIATDALNRAQSGSADPAKIAADTQAVALAQAAYGEAVSKHGAKSIEAARATHALQVAQNSLSDARKAGAPDQDTILQKTNDLTDAQRNLAKATGEVTGTLTDQQKSTAVAALLADQQANVTKQVNDSQNTAAVSGLKAGNKWQDVLEGLADRLLPRATSAFQNFTNWLDQHQGSINGLGDTIGGIVDKVEAVVSFLADHATVIKDLMIAWGLAWTAEKTAGVLNALTAAKDLGKNGLAVKLFPQLSKAGAFGDTVQAMTVKANVVNVSGPGGGGGIGGGGVGGAAKEGEVVAGEAETAGGAAAIASKGAGALGILGTALVVVPLTNSVIQSATGGKAFDIMDPDGYTHLHNPLSSDYGGSDALQNLYGTIAAQATNYFKPDATNDTARQALGSTAVAQAALSGNADELGKLATSLQNDNLASSDTIGQYRLLAQAVADNQIHTQDDLKRFLDLVQRGGTRSGLANVSEGRRFDDSGIPAGAGPAGPNGESSSKAPPPIPPGSLADTTGLKPAGPAGPTSYHAVGGWFDQPKVVGVHAGEGVFTIDQVKALAGMDITPGGRSGGGPLIGELHINQPATDVDVVTAIARVEQHSAYTDVRRVAPPVSTFPPTMKPRSV